MPLEEKIRDEDTQRRTLREDGGRGWSEALLEDTRRIASNYQKQGERHETDSPSRPPEAANSVDNLILSFWPPKLKENPFLLL